MLEQSLIANAMLLIPIVAFLIKTIKKKNKVCLFITLYTGGKHYVHGDDNLKLLQGCKNAYVVYKNS